MADAEAPIIKSRQITYRRIHGTSHLEILWLDCDRCAIWHDANDLFNLAICHRDAAVGPIDGSVRTANPPKTVLHSMHHDETSRIDTPDSSRGYIILARIGYMQRTMK